MESAKLLVAARAQAIADAADMAERAETLEKAVEELRSYARQTAGYGATALLRKYGIEALIWNDPERPVHP